MGSGARRLFALYTPAGSPRLRQAVVLCPSFGQEYIRAHRTVVLLARHLARAGCDVLRFDYFGTGDSAGAGEDLSLHGAVDDAVTAVAEIRDVAPVRDVILVGLRIGAVVAARAARRGGRQTLVLWDPVVDGSGLSRTIRSESLPLSGDPRGAHWRGFPFRGSLLEELDEVSAGDFADLPGRTSVVLSEETAGHAALREVLPAGEDRDDTWDVVPALPCWKEVAATGRGAVPTDVIRRIVERVT
jgi:pimeloyl-ACP methyl ester carboxylesterase